MVCTSNELLEWKDFPKGLRVLLLDEDSTSASDLKSKLEKMEFIVSAFYSEHEAISAISSKIETFHVAIVEVNSHNNDERDKFLESAKDLPTIMTANEHCLSTMMKCIALGAVEFLIKPLSEDKLRNIWQHVVHKAFNAAGNENSESLESIKEFVGSVLASHIQDPEELKEDSETNESNHDHDLEYVINDKFPAPSTPQLKQGGRIFDDGDCQDQTSDSPVKESVELGKEIKSVDITLSDSVTKMDTHQPQVTDEVVIKEEDCGDSYKGTSNSSHSNELSDDKQDATNASSGKIDKKSTPQNANGSKSNRKKVKVDWTPELHKKFVHAVEKLGVDQAIPSRILELMKVEGLTRHNIASHLQKYRMHRRHILPKDNSRRWPHPIDTMQRSYYPSPNRPVMAFPPYHTNHSLAPGSVYPMWGPQGGHPPHHMPMWGPPNYPNWQPVEPWHWKQQSYSGLHADAWGCPVLPQPSCPPHSTFPQVQNNANGFHNQDHYMKTYVDPNPRQEVIDKVVHEAINKPWLPLPIGLKPPSMDSVLAELTRQGISAIPSYINGHHS